MSKVGIKKRRSFSSVTDASEPTPPEPAKEEAIPYEEEINLPLGEQELLALSEEWSELDKEYAAIRERRRVVADKILSEFKAKEIKAVKLKDGSSISVKTVNQKTPTKTSITDEFGKAGRRFWDDLPSKPYSFIARGK